jgi:hypothetical protein
MSKPTTVRHRGVATDTGSSVINDVYWSNYYAYRTRRADAERKVVVWSLVKYDGVVLSDIAGIRAFYALYPRVETIYELTRLTFVLDMFIDMGRFVKQFDRRQIIRSGNIIASGYSVKDTVERSRSWSFARSNTGTPYYGAPAIDLEGSVKSVSYTRTRAPLLNIPVIEPPRIGLPNLSQCGTIAELIYAAFRRTH